MENRPLIKFNTKTTSGTQVVYFPLVRIWMTPFPTFMQLILFVQNYSCLYNKKNNTWLEDMNFIFLW